MKWIETTGGPFVVISAEDAASWSGYRGDDYERACQVSETGSVRFGEPAGHKVALVIGDEPLQTTYLPDRSAFVQWLYADSEEGLLGVVDAHIESAQWEDGPVIEFSDRVVLFDAATPGSEFTQEDYLEIQIEHQEYLLQTADLAPEGPNAARVHRLVPHHN